MAQFFSRGHGGPHTGRLVGAYHPRLQIPAIFSTDFVQCLGDLSQARHSDGTHQLSEHVAALDRNGLKASQRLGCLVLVQVLEGAKACDLVVFLCIGRAAQFDGRRLPVVSGCRWVDEGVDADRGVPQVFLVLVVEAL